VYAPAISSRCCRVVSDLCSRSGPRRRRRACRQSPTRPAASLQLDRIYANGGIGYGLWDAQTTTINTVTGCASCAKTDHAGRGWLGEVGLGYDYQFTDRIVGGLLVNYDVSDMRGRASDAVFTTGKTNDDSTWFIGVRAGWLMTPDILYYWSVGYTRAHFSAASLDNSYTGAPLPNAQLAGYDAGGWFLGGGLEVAMHDGWFWSSEVRYADYSKEVRAETGISPILLLNFDPVVGTGTTEIVYKLNWGH
jgi:outer membrane immunogenic protein